MKRVLSFNMILFSLVVFVIACFSGCEKSEQEVKIDMNIEVAENKVFGSVTYFLSGWMGDNCIFSLCGNGILDENKVRESGENVDKIKVNCVEVDENEVKIELLKDDCYLFVDNIKENSKIKIDFLCENCGLIKNDNDILSFSSFFPLIALNFNKDNLPCLKGFAKSILSPVVNGKIKVKIMSTNVLCASSDVIEVSNEGEKTTYIIKIKNKENFDFLISEKFNVFVKKWGYMPVNCYFKGEYDIEKLVEKLIFVLDFFNEKIGRFPFSSISVCVLKDYSENFRNGVLIIDENKSEKEIIFDIARFVSYNYFGKCVLFDEYEKSYFANGVNNYLSCELIGKIFGKSESFLILNYTQNLLRAFERKMKRENKVFSEVMARKNDDFCREEYNILTFRKGMLLFNKIKSIVGEEVFYNSLRKFYEKNQFELKSEKDFLKCFGLRRKKAEQVFDYIVFKGGQCYLQ